MDWTRQRVPALLTAATLIPMVALVWLGIRTVSQDRQLERQRIREQLEVAAGRLAIDLERNLQSVEEKLARGAAVRFRADGIDAAAATPILFQPEIDTFPSASSHPALALAETAEFQRGDSAAAAANYRSAARVQTPEVRAAALVGLARVLRQRGDGAGALATYDELIALGPVIVAGQPAALVGLQGRCKVFEERGEAQALGAEVVRLKNGLYAGTWKIDKATFGLYQDLLARWHEAPLQAPLAVTEAASDLWRMWRRGDLTSRGRRVLHTPEGSVLAQWIETPDELRVSLVDSAQLASTWQSIAAAQHLTISVADVDGTPVFGPHAPNAVSLPPTRTGLPLIASVSWAEGAAPLPRTRWTLVAALAAGVLVMGVAAFGLYRTTTRELRLAQQQSDFVSAVSHEFRTPITSMRHLSDLLVSGQIRSEERKAQYYELIASETERLHRMVESLLSFGRMDAGGYDWKPEPIDVEPLVRAAISEFRREPIAAGRHVACEVDGALPRVRADRDAMLRALWNLLENAAKYSETSTPIRVFAKRQGDSVLIGVNDSGMGIPPGEHKQVFEKFSRGVAAKQSGIQGVGIGLALVARIAEAHGGTVRLESAPGRGSTFTLVLPCLES
jgi:signal transduction histidine kinase